MTVGRTAEASVKFRQYLRDGPTFTAALHPTAAWSARRNEVPSPRSADAMVPLHLLVTDDDLDKRMLLSRALAREFPHASIFECHSGQEALEYFAANHVDAIITDHNMQPVDGIELIRELRRQGATLPIVMVSGHDEVASEAKAAGVDLFLGTQDLVQIGKPIATFLRERGLDDRKESTAR